MHLLNRREASRLTTCTYGIINFTIAAYYYLEKVITLKRIIAVIMILMLTFLLTGAAKKDGTYVIFIDCEHAKLYLLCDGKLYKQYRCAVGKSNTPSPIGTWKITQKDTWGEGFGGRWMGINCPWGKFGIHGTVFPNSIGWNSSKGCIRMHNNDVKDLYSIVPHGTKVIIEDGAYREFGKGFRNLKPGSYGADVLLIQKRLAELGFYGGYANGRYESSLESAVNKFQRKNNLYVTNTITPQLQMKMGFILME